MLVVEDSIRGKTACITKLGAQMFLSSKRPVSLFNVHQITDELQ